MSTVKEYQVCSSSSSSSMINTSSSPAITVAAGVVVLVVAVVSYTVLRATIGVTVCLAKIVPTD